MKNEEFTKRLAEASTIQELVNLRPTVSTQQVARIKDKTRELCAGEGWEYVRMSTSTLKTIVGWTNAGTGSLTEVTVQNSRKLKKWGGKRVMVYVQEKYNQGSDSGVFVKEVK